MASGRLSRGGPPLMDVMVRGCMLTIVLLALGVLLAAAAWCAVALSMCQELRIPRQMRAPGERGVIMDRERDEMRCSSGADCRMRSKSILCLPYAQALSSSGCPPRCRITQAAASRTFLRMSMSAYPAYTAYRASSTYPASRNLRSYLCATGCKREKCSERSIGAVRGNLYMN